MKCGAFNIILKYTINLQWKQPISMPPRLACMYESHVKIMLITFFDIKVIVQFEFIPQGQTVNQAYYVEIMK